MPDYRGIFPDLSVEENLVVAARGRNGEGWTVEKVYDFFPNLKKYRKRGGTRSSGGEQQMLTIGRTLMTNPSLLLLDEPVEGLAPLVVKAIGERLKYLRENEHLTILLSEQNVKFALGLSDRAYIIEKGVIKYEGSMKDLAADEEVKHKYLGAFRKEAADGVRRGERGRRPVAGCARAGPKGALFAKEAGDRDGAEGSCGHSDRGRKGIGKAIAEKYAEEGASVALFSRSPAQLEEVAQAIDPSGERVMFGRVDVTSESDVREGVAAVLQKFGRIDVLVNNAGANYPYTRIEEMSLEVFKALIDVNLVGAFLCCPAVAPLMKEHGSGKIINVSSLAGRTGRPNVGVNYGASKAGMIGLTQTLARELGPSGICVNSIAPGPILTELMKQFPPEAIAAWNAGRAMPRNGVPEDIAGVAVFLASPRSDWLTGVTIDVNGGIAMLP